MSVIDSISTGFRLVTRKPWLMAIPVILDLFLWLGPGLSPRPLVEELWQSVSFEVAGLNATNGASGVATLQDLTQELGGNLAQLNLFGLLAFSRLGVPTFVGMNSLPFRLGRIYEIQTVWQLLLFEALLLGMGLLIAATFLSLVGWEVRGHKGFAHLPRWILTTWVRLLKVIVPIGLIMLAILISSIILGPLILLPLVLLLVGLLHIVFFPQGIAMMGQSSRGALLTSVQIVRLYFWPTLGLLFLVMILGNGWGIIWQRLAGQSRLMIFLAILGSAYIGTSLTAALFVFYRDRLILLQEIMLGQRNV